MQYQYAQGYQRTYNSRLGGSMYELEELIAQFNEHAKQAEKSGLEWIKSFLDNNPGQPLPDHLTEEFSLPKALVSICEEIEKLWISIGGR